MVLLCVALAVWSATPPATHAPAVFDVIQDHLEMIADHGHSHGFEDDLAWALHGHSHDAADHDHLQEFLTDPARVPAAAVLRDVWRIRGAPDGSYGSDRIDRPPRA